MDAKTSIFLFVCLIALCVATSPFNSLDGNKTEEVVPVAENLKNNNLKGPLGCIQTKWGCFDPANVAIQPRLELDDDDKEEKHEKFSVRRHCECVLVPGIGCVYPCDAPVRP